MNSSIPSLFFGLVYILNVFLFFLLLASLLDLGFGVTEGLDCFVSVEG